MLRNREILLAAYREDGPERIGVILHNGHILERPNVHTEPDNNCALSTEDLISFDGFMKATWHTHPGGESNLSGEDAVAFQNWPELAHFIVGKDGIRCYIFDETKGALIETDSDQMLRVLEETHPG